jgi:hypothetical protein
MNGVWDRRIFELYYKELFYTPEVIWTLFFLPGRKVVFIIKLHGVVKVNDYLAFYIIEMVNPNSITVYIIDNGKSNFITVLHE